jgi:CRP-like cAMP-binding protein
VHAFASREDRLPEIRARSIDSPGGTDAIPNLLSPDHQFLLKGISTLVEWGNGKGAIFTEGEDASFLYTVASGMVRVSRYTESGRRQILTFVLPGGVFGFPESGAYANSAKPVGSVALYRVPWNRLNELLQREPQLQATFMTRLVFDLQRAQSHLLVLGQQNVTQRIASFLLDLMQHEDFYDARGNLLLLPVSRFDLADYLGTSPETVARALAKLEGDKILVRVSSRQIAIPHPERLSALLQVRRRNH